MEPGAHNAGCDVDGFVSNASTRCDSASSSTSSVSVAVVDVEGMSDASEVGSALDLMNDESLKKSAQNHFCGLSSAPQMDVGKTDVVVLDEGMRPMATAVVSQANIPEDVDGDDDEVIEVKRSLSRNGQKCIAYSTPRVSKDRSFVGAKSLRKDQERTTYDKTTKPSKAWPSSSSSRSSPNGSAASKEKIWPQSSGFASHGVLQVSQPLGSEVPTRPDVEVVSVDSPRTSRWLPPPAVLANEAWPSPMRDNLPAPPSPPDFTLDDGKGTPPTKSSETSGSCSHKDEALAPKPVLASYMGARNPGMCQMLSSGTQSTKQEADSVDDEDLPLTALKANHAATPVGSEIGQVTPDSRKCNKNTAAALLERYCTPPPLKQRGVAKQKATRPPSSPLPLAARSQAHLQDHARSTPPPLKQRRVAKQKAASRPSSALRLAARSQARLPSALATEPERPLRDSDARDSEDEPLALLGNSSALDKVPWFDGPAVKFLDTADVTEDGPWSEDEALPLVAQMSQPMLDWRSCIRT